MNIKNTNVSCIFEEKKTIRYSSIYETTKDIYKTEGIFTFTRGVSARMMLNTPAIAISWGTYELIKGYLA